MKFQIKLINTKCEVLSTLIANICIKGQFCRDVLTVLSLLCLGFFSKCLEVVILTIIAVKNISCPNKGLAAFRLPSSYNQKNSHVKFA